MAASSIHVAAGVGPASVGSSVRGFPSIPGGGDSVSMSHSRVWRPGQTGSVRTRAPLGAVRSKGLPERGSTVVCSANFFEKFGHLFLGDPAEEEQVMAVYEINEKDRGSPVVVYHTSSEIPSLGDFVPYTNKVYGPSGKDYLGLSAGLCTVIEQDLVGTRFETTYTHYLDGYGQLSGMGAYYQYKDSEMVVTGGTGIFKGARGFVKIHNVVAPIQLTYTYYLTGIQKLPPQLSRPIVPLPKK